MHLSDGTLRRSIDEPFSLHPGQRTHLGACLRCEARATAIRSDAELAAGLLSAVPAPTSAPGPGLPGLAPALPASPPGPLAPPAPAPRPPAAATRGALARLQPRLAPSQGSWRSGWLRDPRRSARTTRWSAGIAGGAAVALMLVAAGVPQDFITIFQPSQLAPVAVSASDLTVLQDLSNYGDVSGVPSPTVTPATPAQARQATGVALPASVPLPSGIPTTPSYYVLGGGTVSFTFDEAKAQAAARQHGATLPPMPADISGSTLQLTLHPTLVAAYSVDLGALSDLAGLGSVHQQGGAAAPSTGSALGGGTSATPPPAAPAGDATTLSGVVIVASRAPTVRSSGATAAEIEDYLLAQPGVPASLAAEIRALGNPSTTLPVPIPVDMTGAQQVTIGRDRGLLIGDQTGIGSLAVWLHSGVVYAVAGSISSTQVLQIADSIG